MATFAPSSSSSSSASASALSFSEKPMPLSSADDAFEDACSICLEPFTTAEPATVTSCRHDYHLQCILEWSQRSKECPICWQQLILKDPASQELLAAVQNERSSRLRNSSPAMPTAFHHFHDAFDVDEDSSHSDDSDFDERIMRHLATAASRVRHLHRRERQRSSGLGPSRVSVFPSPENMTMPEEFQNSSYGSSLSDSPTLHAPSVPIGPPSPVTPSVDMVPTAVNRDGSIKSRVFNGQPQHDSPQGSPSDMFSLSESIKSKWSAASARYKESISKSTRGLKEKLAARNNSVKELSKGVQREMTAGIAGVARMIERLDLASKRPGTSIPLSSHNCGTSNFSFKGKGVQENVIVQNSSKSDGEVAHDLNSDAPSFTSHVIPGQVEVSSVQREH